MRRYCIVLFVSVHEYFVLNFISIFLFDSNIHSQIEFRGNSNKNSRLAIEYIYILNSAINSVECSRDSIIPTEPSSEGTEPDDTTQSSTSDASNAPTTTAASASESLGDDETWTIIGIVIGVCLLIILLIVGICVVIKYKKRKLLVVAPKLPDRSVDNNNYASLPRLCVVKDKVNGLSIVSNARADNNNGIDNSNLNYPR